MATLSSATFLSQSLQNGSYTDQRSVVSLPLPSLLLSYVIRGFLFPCPHHALCQKMQKRCWVATSVTMRKFLPRWLGTDWSQTISFSPRAHCFPPVTFAIQKQLQIPVKQRSDPTPQAILTLSFFSLEGGKRKILEKLPWCIIFKHLLMEVWAKQPFLLEERKGKKCKKKRVFK